MLLILMVTVLMLGVTAAGALVQPKGGVAGTVTADGGGNLAGIAVRLYKYGGSSYVSNDWGQEADTVSGADGKYSFSDLDEGVYRVRFSDNTTYAREYYNNAWQIETANNVVVTGGTTQTVDVALTKAGFIGGKVTDQVTGKEIANAHVRVAREGLGGGWHQAWTNDYTGASGTYSIRKLPPAVGAYRVWVEAPGYRAEYHNDAASEVTATLASVTAETTTPIDFALEPIPVVADGYEPDDTHTAAKVSAVDGTVYEHSVNTTADVDWRKFDTVAGRRYMVTWNELSGALRMRTLDTDTVTSLFTRTSSGHDHFTPGFGATYYTKVTTATGNSYPGAYNISVWRQPRIRGTVTCSGNSTEGVDVELRYWNGGSWGSFDTTSTDATTGAYYFDVDKTGLYTLYFSEGSETYLSEWYDNATDGLAAKRLSVVTSTDEIVANADLARAAQFSGTVTNEASNAPLPEIKVNVYSQFAGPGDGDGYGFVRSASTDASGTYTIFGLPGGAYRVEFMDPHGQYLTEYYNDKTTSIATADDVVVAAGTAKTGVDAKLAKSAHIMGTVRGRPDGKPLWNAYVEVFRFNPSTSSWDDWADDHTDAAGAYDVGWLMAGTYRVGFWGPDGTYAGEFYNKALDVQLGTDVTMTLGQIRTIDTTLNLASHITGTVTDKVGGAPLSNIHVRLLKRPIAPEPWWLFGWDSWDGDWDSWNNMDTTVTGAFRFDALQPGSYRLWLWDNAGTYGAEFHKGAVDFAQSTDITVGAEATVSGVNVQLSAAAADAFEPDNSPAKAITATIDGARTTHTIFPQADVDYLAFTATRTGTYVIQTFSALDTQLDLYGDTGTGLRGSDDDNGGMYASRLFFRALGGGKYYARTSIFSGSSKAVGAYQISVTRATSQTVLLLGAKKTKLNYGQKAVFTGSLVTSGSLGRGQGEVWLYRTVGSKLVTETIAKYVPRYANYTATSKALTGNTRFTMKFLGDQTDLASQGSVLVKAGASLSKPVVPRRASRAGFTASGTLRPRHSTTVKLYFFRKSGRRWVRVKILSVRTTNPRGKSYSAYKKTRIKLPRGTYQVKAYHSDSGHLATYSKVTGFTVR